MKIGDKIYKLRKENNLSQEELANKLNVSRQTVSKWELGDSCPDFDKIVPLCDIFNISTEELLRGKDVNNNFENNDIQNNTKSNTILKSLLYSIAVFILFIAFVSAAIMDDFLHLNSGLVGASFLTLIGLSVSIFVFTHLVFGKVNKTDSKKEVVNSNNNQVVKSIISIISIITTIIYLYVSFVTSRWDITWLIWLIYACIVEIVKLIFRLLGGTIDEK